MRLRRSSKGKREGGQSKAGENQTEENKHPTKPSHNKLLPLERALRTTLKRPERNMYAGHINESQNFKINPVTAPPIQSRVALMRLSWLFPVCGSGFDFTHAVGARKKKT